MADVTCSLCDRKVIARGWCWAHYQKWRRTGDPLSEYVKMTLLERALRYFTPAGDGCWEWTGHKGSSGYGHVSTRGSSVVAHRVVYEGMVGPIPDGLELDHLCRNRVCVNPAHLEPVTRAENARRAALRVTHCPQGHPYDEANTRRYRGRRYCRACSAQR